MQSRKPFAVAFTLLLSFTLFLSGCSDSYTTAVKAADAYAQVIASVTKEAQSLYSDKLIDATEFKNFITWNGLANQYGSEFLEEVESIHSDPNSGSVKYLNAANTFAGKIQALNANQALRVKNPQAQVAVSLVLQGVQDFLTNVSKAIQAGKQQGDFTVTVAPPAPPAPAPARTTPTPTTTPAPPAANSNPTTAPAVTPTPNVNVTEGAK